MSLLISCFRFSPFIVHPSSFFFRRGQLLAHLDQLNRDTEGATHLGEQIGVLATHAGFMRLDGDRGPEAIAGIDGRGAKRTEAFLLTFVDEPGIEGAVDFDFLEGIAEDVVHGNVVEEQFLDTVGHGENEFAAGFGQAVDLEGVGLREVALDGNPTAGAGTFDSLG